MKLEQDHGVETVGDYVEQAKRLGFGALPPDRDADERIMHGRNGFVSLRPGLTLHYSEAVDLEDIKLEADCPPNISVKVFLSGSIDARIGAFQIPMPQRDGDAWEPVAVLLAQPRADRFVRHCSKGTQLRKVTVSFTQSWLAGSDLFSHDNARLLSGFTQCHLAHKSWSPSALCVATAEQILNPPDLAGVALSLYYESRSLVLIAEALQQILLPETACERPAMKPQDSRRLAAVNAFIELNPRSNITTERLAAEVGASAATLRRLVRNAHGLSLFDYIRHRKLVRARIALEIDYATIAEAAHVAGYTSTANFSTAFKREFGLAPSQVRKRAG